MDVKDCYNCLTENDLSFFCGVPDSLLKDFCNYVSDNAPGNKHIITANEGNAIALASGHYLATGRSAVVYMQNSGLGNCVNPLLSLNDKDVYNIPLLMIIGWRGEPNKKDEPQHIKQGKVTGKLLKAMGIEYRVLPKNIDEAKIAIKYGADYMKKTKKPYALIVQKNTFEKYSLINKKENNYEMARECAIASVCERLSENDIVVSTTGQISRELYEYRGSNNQAPGRDFLTVGSMGHASSLSLGIALEKPEKNVFCFDGDGALLMHMGALPTIGSMQLENFKHIVFNNEAHDSVGSQPTCACAVDFKSLATSCGYTGVYSISTKDELKEIWDEFYNKKGCQLLEIKVKCGARADLGRPKEKPRENKEKFISYLEQNIVFSGKNSINHLEKLTKKLKSKNVLIFTGKKSWEKIKDRVEKNLKGVKIQTYNDFSSNPKAQEVDTALQKLGGFDTIIAIGGGSVMDFAKLFRFCYDNNLKTEDALKDDFKALKYIPLVAIPTTAGTGAEATKFAVVYLHGKKYSFEHEYILPDFAIIESGFTKDNPPYLKACCAADALCQAIESYWSLNSNDTSKYYAREAMELCRDFLEKYVHSHKDEYAEKISQAAFLSGRAINISKTTAAHALSYKITSDFDIAHGHAVSLSIAKLMKINAHSKNIADPRGIKYVRKTIKEIKEILKIKNIEKYFKILFKNIGLEQTLSKLGIENIEEIVDATNPERLKNNPILLSKSDLKNLFYL